jgi:hypothetical protein
VRLRCCFGARSPQNAELVWRFIDPQGPFLELLSIEFSAGPFRMIVTLHLDGGEPLQLSKGTASSHCGENYASFT